MVVDLELNNARVYDVTKFDVLVGEPFKLIITEAADPANIRWFSDNDPSLMIITNEDNSIATVTATATGKVIIQIQEGIGNIVKQLDIEVYDTQAVSLNIKAGTPTLKD